MALGSAYCSACGKPVAPPSRPGQPACAVHPELAAAQTCPRCGSFACAACLVALPGNVVLCRRCEAAGQKVSLPWDRRDELGMMRAWWQTSMKLLASPTATLAQAPREGSVGSSLLFASISNLAGMATTAALYAVVLGGVFAFALKGEDNPLGKVGVAGGVGIVAGGFLGYLILAVVAGAMGLLLMSALDQLALRLVKADPAPWPVTLRAGALSMAPYVIGLIPLCGLYVFPIWSLVLKVFAYRAMHRTTGGKAAAGALLPMGALMVAFVVLYAAVLIGVLALVPDKHH